MSKKEPKLLVDRVIGRQYVRAFREGRTSIVVQVWNTRGPYGEPAGDWAMPAVLGVEVAVKQAIIQTPEDES